MKKIAFPAANAYSTLQLSSLHPSPTLAPSQWSLPPSPAPTLFPALFPAPAPAPAPAPSRPHLKQTLKSQCPGTFTVNFVFTKAKPILKSRCPGTWLYKFTRQRTKVNRLRSFDNTFIRV